MTPGNSTQGTSSENSTSANGHVSVLEISPYPRAASNSTGARKRKAEVATVLTSTPNKTLLEEKQRKKT